MSMTKLHANLKRAIRQGNEAEQRRIIIRMRESKMAVRSMDTGELHRLNSDHKTCQDIRRYRNPKGPRDYNLLKGRAGNR